MDYTYRFLATMAALREALGSGRHIRAMRAVFHNIYGPGQEKRWFFDPATSGGGALIDLGVHLVDLGLWLAQPAAERFAPLPAGWDALPALPSFYDEQLGFGRHGASLAAVESVFQRVLAARARRARPGSPA